MMYIVVSFVQSRPLGQDYSESLGGRPPHRQTQTRKNHDTNDAQDAQNMG